MPRTGGVAEGAELARGYISLSIKYGSAMSQIDRDLAETEVKAGRSGEAAGMAHGQGMASGLTRSSSDVRRAASDSLENVDRSMLATAKRIGSGVGETLSGMLTFTARRNLGEENWGKLIEGEDLNRHARMAGVAAGGLMVKGVADGVNLGRDSIEGAAAMGGAAFEHMAEKGKAASAEMGAGVMGLVSGPMLALGAAVTSVAGVFEVMKGGFERLETLQHAKEQMEALGYSSEQVESVFKDMQQAVKGTQFGIEELAGITKVAMMQGIQPGQQMVSYLKEIENAAVLTNMPLEQVSGMMDRLRTRSYATMREMVSMTKQGLPIAKWIKDDLHLTDEQFSDFVKHHGVTYQLFMDELGRHTHEGAEKMAHSIAGETHRMGENLKAIGSDLVAPFFGSIPQMLDKINTKLEQFDGFLQSHAHQIQTFVHNVFGPIGNLMSGLTRGIGSFASGTIQGVKDSHEGMSGGIGTAVSSFVNAVRTAGNWLKTHTDQVRSWGAAFGHAIGNVQHVFHNIEHAGGNVGHAIGNVVHAFENVGHAVGNVMHAFGNIAHAFGNVFHALGLDIVARLVGTVLKSAFDTGLAVVLAVWHTLQGLWHAAEGVWHVLTELTQGPIKLVNALFHEIGGYMQRDLKPALEDVGRFLRDMAEAGVKVVDFFVHLPEKLISAMGDFGKDVANAIGDALSHIHIPGFAEGAVLPHQATIAGARPGGLVQWAESSTGGEAFIPLHPSKRARSVQLWHQTGKLLGIGGNWGAMSDKSWSGVGSHKYDSGGIRRTGYAGPDYGGGSYIGKDVGPSPSTEYPGPPGSPGSRGSFIWAPKWWHLGILNDQGIPWWMNPPGLNQLPPPWLQTPGDINTGGQSAVGRRFDDGGVTGIGSLGILDPDLWARLKRVAPGLWEKLKRAGTFMAQPTAFDKGGIRLDPNPDRTTPANLDDPELPQWLHDWIKGTGPYAGLAPFTGRWLYEDGRVITRGMPHSASEIRGASGPHPNLDPRSVIGKNDQGRRSLGDVLGSGSPGNEDSYFGMYDGGPNYRARAEHGAILAFAEGGILHGHTHPGGGPGIGTPDWGPQTKWGDPPKDWWGRPIDPDDILFPEYMPPGERQRWLERWGKKRKRIKSYAQGGIRTGAADDGVEPQIHAVERIAGRFRLKLTSGRRSEPGSYHNSGEAGDFSNGDKTPGELAFANYMARHYRSRLAELIHDDPSFSSNVKDGKLVGPFGKFYTMGQAGYHGDHVHIAIRHDTPFGAADLGRARRSGPRAVSSRSGRSSSGSGGGGGGLFGMIGRMLSGHPFGTGDSGLGDAPSPSGDPVAAIVAEGRRRGYSDEDIAWIVADAMGESNLDPNVGDAHHGLFQQDSGYPGRGTMRGQITGFYDRLDKTSSRMSIGERISKSPAEGGVEGGGYGPDWIARNLGKAQSAVAGVSGLSAGSGRGSRGLTAADEEKEDRKEREIADKIDDLTTKIKETQDDIDHPHGKKPRTPEATEKLNDRLGKLNRELEEAKSDQKTMKTDYASRSALGDRGGDDDRGGRTGLGALFSDDDIGSLGDIGMNSIMQSFLPEGFINPFGTTAMHAGSVIFSFLGALMSGKGSNMTKALLPGGKSRSGGRSRAGDDDMADDDADLDFGGGSADDEPASLPGMPNAVASNAGGGGPTIDNSQHFEGASFGHSNEAIAPVIKNAKTATDRATGTIDSQRIWTA